MNIDVSVVVPTYRRHDLLVRCLEALIQQDLSPTRYEIIVADDDANPATRSLVETFSKRRPIAIRYIPVMNTQGPAAARNVGWRAARGLIVALTDDDCIPDSSWLREGLAAFGDNVDAVSGRVVMPLPDRPTDYERDAAGLMRAEFVTANCFCRRAALEAVGGFDERFTMAWREDSDLQFSLLEHGFRIVRAPRAVVVHPVRPATWGVSLWQQRKSVFNALLFRKHPDLYRERLPTFPKVYYAIVLLSFTALFCFLTGDLMLAAAATAGWGAAVAWFCNQRLRGTSRRPGHVVEMIVTSALIPYFSVYWLIRGNLRYAVFRF